MKYIFVIALLLPVLCVGQKFQVSLASGYGAYAMAGMKTHQSQISRQFPIPLTISESFPGFWYHELSGLALLGSRFHGGLSLSYGSTRGRMDYQDDPEEITCNQDLSAVSISPRLVWRVNRGNDKFLIDAGLKGGVVYSKYKLEVTSFIANQVQAEMQEFKSRNFLLEPGVTFTRSLVGSLGVHLYAGYNFNFFQGKVYFKEEEKAFLENNAGEPVYIDWSGIRIGGGISLLFGK